MSEFIREVGKSETDAWLEVDRLRNALTWIRRHIEAAKSEDDINIDEIHDMAKF